MKAVSLELCGMYCTDLTNKAIKILGIHFSDYKKLEGEDNFIRHVTTIKIVLKLQRMRSLTVEGKTTISKLEQNLKFYFFQRIEENRKILYLE